MSRKKTLLQRSCLNVEKKRSAVTDQETRKETTSSNETKLDLEYEEKRKSLNRGIYFRPISIDCDIYCLVSCITRRGNDETRQDETKETIAERTRGWLGERGGDRDEDDTSFTCETIFVEQRSKRSWFSSAVSRLGQKRFRECLWTVGSWIRAFKSSQNQEYMNIFEQTIENSFVNVCKLFVYGYAPLHS